MTAAPANGKVAQSSIDVLEPTLRHALVAGGAVARGRVLQEGVAATACVLSAAAAGAILVPLLCLILRLEPVLMRNQLVQVRH